MSDKAPLEILFTPSDKVLVDRAALRQVLEALDGPGHLIRELQFTRSLPDNPINQLIDQYNEGLPDAD